jgi:NADH-quinone oxidoreductase subunit F
MDEATSAGYLGADVTGAGFTFDVEIRRGAGAYICGEETALFNSIEGYRGEPRSKPPFPTENGLFGRPTVINNVETLSAVTALLAGCEDAGEAKLFCVSGTVERPGLYEAPLGTSVAALVAAAGATDVGAVLVGGAAGRFLGSDDLDAPLDYSPEGPPIGSGAVVVFDETVDMDGTVLRIAEFFRDESCGQCVPCRVGTVRLEEALHRMVDGSATEGPLIRDVAAVMRDASICGLGQTATGAIESALELGLIGSGDRRG